MLGLILLVSRKSIALRDSTYVGSHILQAFIQASKHAGELLTPDEAASPWSVHAPRDRFEKAIVLQTVIDAIRQLCEPPLLLYEPFTLLLKGCGLSLDSLEGIR